MPFFSRKTRAALEWEFWRAFFSQGGSPYEPDENLIIAEKRIDTTTVSGYTTTTMSLTS